LPPESFFFDQVLTYKNNNGSYTASPSLKTGQHVPLSRILTKLFNLEGMLEKAASYMNDKNGTLLSDFKDGSLWEKKLRNLRLVKIRVSNLYLFQ